MQIDPIARAITELAKEVRYAADTQAKAIEGLAEATARIASGPPQGAPDGLEGAALHLGDKFESIGGSLQIIATELESAFQKT